MRRSLLALLMLALPACGGEKPCPVNLATGMCGDCLQAQCNSQFTSCYGPSWRSGVLTGGVCASYASCINRCCPAPSCRCNTQCTNDCAAQITAECRTCGQMAIQCQLDHCLQPCSAPPPDAGGGQ